jgi:hypothetical protein
MGATGNTLLSPGHYEKEDAEEHKASNNSEFIYLIEKMDSQSIDD